MMKTVCVTGASGYIGSWLVKFLLHRGYTVKACVLDLNDTKETTHLLTLEGARERLHLFKANLLDEGSFDAAIDGCECVFHLACPVYFDVEDPQAEMIDPAVKGTVNVLGSCARVSSIRKVVLTSTLGCNLCTEKYPAADDIIDETWWSVPDICRERKLWHVLSKTLAEEAAWKFAKDKGINMVAMNPGLVVGPMLQPTLNASSASIFNLVNGAETFPNLQFWWVDVRDVANAHILAFENPSSNGRYCLVKGVKHYSEIVQILRKLYPSMKLPERCANDQPFVPLFQVSKEKANSLGLEFTPLEQTMKDTNESFQEKNFLKTSAAC